MWALWVENALYFGGEGQTRWQRNVKNNHKVAVHLDSSDDVVIVEGVAEWIADANDPIRHKLDEASKAKYNMPSGLPCWVLRPRVVFAWSAFPKNATRWVFE